MKTALIIGGSGGIGTEIARLFLKNGFRVVVFARGGAALRALRRVLEKEGDIRALSVDVSDYAQVKKGVAAVARRSRGIHTLINAAGVHGAMGFLPETDVKKWHEAVRVNLLGTFNAIHAVMPYMRRARSGKIINFSGGGTASPRPFFSAYAASKAGIVNLTQNLAAELREKKARIEVNVVAPGAVSTRLLDEMLAAGPKKVGAKEYKNLVAQKKNGGASAENVAELCLFLASKESDGISGKFISAVHDNWRSLSKHKKTLMSTDIYTLRRVKPKDRGYDW